MREISKNMDTGKIPKQDVKFCGTEKAEPQVTIQEGKEIKDFSNPTEILGRSQVNKVDNLQADVAFSIANPEAVESADKFFDMAYAQLQKKGDPEAYEKASAIAVAYVQELA